MMSSYFTLKYRQRRIPGGEGAGGQKCFENQTFNNNNNAWRAQPFWPGGTAITESVVPHPLDLQFIVGSTKKTSTKLLNLTLLLAIAISLLILVSVSCIELVPVV